MDQSLATRITEANSETFGLNNITVEGEERVGTISFSDNGTSELGTPEHSYIIHPGYTQSTPTTKGQFEEFVPPGNLINACLSEEYSSTTGMTFVYMTGRDKKAIIADTTDDLLKSPLLLSISKRELNESHRDPPGWLDRNGVVPYTYIDDSNGCERLNLANKIKTYSCNRQTTLIHAKKSETFFKRVEERSSRLGMKINAKKTQLLCVSPSGSDTRSFVRISGDERTESDDSLKICGYRFGTKPSVSEQGEALERKFNERAWVLRNLKRSGFSKPDLVTTYTSLI